MEWFDSEIYTTFYSQNGGLIVEEPAVAHRLSLLFMVFAIGSLMNTALPAYNLDAEKYHQLSRAALFHFSFVDNPTLTAVQTLVSINCIIEDAIVIWFLVSDDFLFVFWRSAWYKLQSEKPHYGSCCQDCSKC